MTKRTGAVERMALGTFHAGGQAVRVVAGCLTLLAGCAQGPLRALPEDPRSVAVCAGETAGSIALSASALPIRIPTELAGKGPLETRGMLVRRLVVTFAPGSFAHGESLLWNRLAVRTLGGTLQGWTRLQSDALLIEAAGAASPRAGSRRPARRELAAIEAGAGYLNVTRSALSGTHIANTLSVDLLILPGGIPIDESIVRMPELWSSDGRPLAPDAVRIDFEPVRHVPGYDTVEADVTLDYVLWRGRAGSVCHGSAHQRTTLVDKEAVRPPLWDLGVSSINAPRTRWLGFSSPAHGVFRAVFDSPTAATSFANWIRATRSARVGPYRLGLFERDGQPLRPLVPVDRGAPGTFRILTSEEIQALRTGPLGEP